jgi:hypothetical protein
MRGVRRQLLCCTALDTTRLALASRRTTSCYYRYAVLQDIECIAYLVQVVEYL